MSNTNKSVGAKPGAFAYSSKTFVTFSDLRALFAILLSNVATPICGFFRRIQIDKERSNPDARERVFTHFRCNPSGRGQLAAFVCCSYTIGLPQGGRSYGP